MTEALESYPAIMVNFNNFPICFTGNFCVILTFFSHFFHQVVYCNHFMG